MRRINSNGYMYHHYIYDNKQNYKVKDKYAYCEICVRRQREDGTTSFRPGNHYDQADPKDWTFWNIRVDPEANTDAAILSHLATHKIVACEHCGKCVNKKNLKRHQSTPLCQVSARCARLEREGYRRLYWYDKNRFSNYFEEMFNRLVGDQTSQQMVDLKTMQRALNARTKVEYTIKSKLGWRTEYTTFICAAFGRPSRTEPGVWIKAEYSNFVEWLPKQYPSKYDSSYSRTARHSEDAIAMLWQYIHSNKTQRDAMQCIMELSQEATNGNY